MNTVISAIPGPTSPPIDDKRRAHRKVCVVAGSLAVLGGVLGLAIHPGFSLLAVIGGIWLIVAPDRTSC